MFGLMNHATKTPVTERRATAPGERGLRIGTTPTVSVVVAATGTREGIDACLDALRGRCRDHGIEVVVAVASSGTELLAMQSRYPDVLFMPAPDGCTARQLRGYGMAAAEGDIVVMVTDRRPPSPQWIDDVVALVQAAAEE